MFARVLSEKFQAPIWGIAYQGNIPAYYVVLIGNKYLDIKGIYKNKSSLLTSMKLRSIKEDWNSEEELRVIEVDQETLDNTDLNYPKNIVKRISTYVDLIDDVTVEGLVI